MTQQLDLAALAAAFMKRHGLTRGELAAMLGYSPGRAGYNTVTRWLTGNGDPPPPLPLALAELERQLAARRASSDAA